MKRSVRSPEEEWRRKEAPSEGGRGGNTVAVMSIGKIAQESSRAFATKNAWERKASASAVLAALMTEPAMQDVEEEENADGTAKVLCVCSAEDSVAVLLAFGKRWTRFCFRREMRGVGEEEVLSRLGKVGEIFKRVYAFRRQVAGHGGLLGAEAIEAIEAMRQAVVARLMEEGGGGGGGWDIRPERGGERLIFLHAALGLLGNDVSFAVALAPVLEDMTRGVTTHLSSQNFQSIPNLVVEFGTLYNIYRCGVAQALVASGENIQFPANAGEKEEEEEVEEDKDEKEEEEQEE